MSSSVSFVDAVIPEFCAFRYERRTDANDSGDLCRALCAPQSQYCLKHAYWMRRKLKRRLPEQSSATIDRDEGTGTSSSATARTDNALAAAVTDSQVLALKLLTDLSARITDLSIRLTALSDRIGALEMARVLPRPTKPAQLTNLSEATDRQLDSLYDIPLQGSAAFTEPRLWATP